MALDMALILLALWLAFMLRFDGNPGPVYLKRFALAVPYFVLCSLPLYMSLGLYHSIWKYSSFRDYLAILAAVTLASLPLVLGRLFMIFLIPYGVLGMNWFISLVLVGGVRAATRLRAEFGRNKGAKSARKILVIGAGQAGAMILRELRTSGLQCTHHPVGFVDDDPAKQRRVVNGLKVLGGREHIPGLVREKKIDEIIIAMPSAPRSIIREIVSICRETAAALKILPGLYQLIDGQVSVKALRDVAIEDLLGRPPIAADLDEIASYLRGEVVLVTGAGGSIGSELCRQIARFTPAKLLLLGRGEHAIYEIHQELTGTVDESRVPSHESPVPSPQFRVTSHESRVHERRATSSEQRGGNHPDHRGCPGPGASAAYLRRVPAGHRLSCGGPQARASDGGIPGRGRKEQCLRHPQRGRTRPRIWRAELRVALDGQSCTADKHTGGDQTYRRTDRTESRRPQHHQVLRGQVRKRPRQPRQRHPPFQRQIAMGGPVTVTDPRMVRFFMTIPEAANLVIQAGAMGKGGEIFVLDMGEPVRILDLARDLIRLSGYEPGKDVEIVVTGPRPGEKLYEEVLTAEEGVSATKHERIFVTKPERSGGPELRQILDELTKACVEPAAVVQALETLVPDYAVDPKWRDGTGEGKQRSRGEWVKR